MPTEALVPLAEAEDALLLCSGYLPRFHPQTFVQELAFAHELSKQGRPFAVTDDPALLSEKQVAWFLPGAFITPRLWDYSRQMYDFARGLEQQGNRLFCSSAELLYWENKAHMHRRLAEISAPTPRTEVLTSENWQAVEFDIEPNLIKEEHSAGSAGVHYFAHAEDARSFVGSYPFRPTECLLMQEVVRGATKDMRITLVGDTVIRSATFWRTKTAEALSTPEWTTTATKYDSVVLHDDLPESAVALSINYLQRLGLRTAGVDLMWIDDDTSQAPLILELSPYYQPNPPKPRRYAHWSYKEFKRRPYVAEGYLSQQYLVFREIWQSILHQRLF